MNRLIITLSALALSAGAYAQVGTAVKEAAKATAEKTEQVGDQAKAAVTTGATRDAAHAKAAEHKQRAHHHAEKAKEAASSKGTDKAAVK